MLFAAGLFVFIFGLIVGSFLNVVAYRYGTGRSAFRGRSQCFHCAATLRWFELIPLVSFIVLRRRCRTCRGPISWQYPLVELLTAVLFIASIVRGDGWLETVLLWLLWSVAIVIVVYDSRHKIIPDGLVVMFSLAALALMLNRLLGGVEESALWAALAGPILAAPLALLWLVSRGRWIGLGDAKLALGVGWFLGLPLGITALIYSFWIGAAVAVALLTLSAVTRITQSVSQQSIARGITMKSEIPFAPFIIAGSAATFFTGVDVFGFGHLAALF